MPGTTFTLSPGQTGTHVPVSPGGSIIVRGAFHCRYDGTTIDAASTAWPQDAPGGASRAAVGIIDFGAGGFEIVAHDALAHEVQAVATGAAAPACTALGLPAPCLLLRSGPLAHHRLLTVRDFTASLGGEMTVHNPVPAALTITDSHPTGHLTGDPIGVDGAAGWLPDWALTGAVTWAAMLFGVGLWLIYRRWAGSARHRLTRLVRRIKRTAMTADPVLSQVLGPALTSMARALRNRRLDPGSVAGRRLEQSLRQLHSELVSGVIEKQRRDQRQVADDLGCQLQLAVEAAAEASRAA
jgi:hypothetical protein